MALPPLATVPDLEALVPGTVDVSRAEAVLTRVSSLVRSEAGRTWEGTDPPDAVVAVTLEVAKRVYLNPHNMRQASTGPFGGTYDLVGLYLLPDEKRIITRAVTSRRGLFTLATTRGEDWLGTTYVPTGPEPSGYDFPWYSDDV